ncbi:glycine zipper family protein [Chryseobacterium sp. MMS23-Vi53]|uniref:glycine zipper family protein n=1 Tax=Chryseobacterium sp. MMS23-Vi53 TaxID=3386644 RepID=UPI0039E9EFE3
MKKTLQIVFLSLSILIFSQRTETIEIGKIKDKSGMTRSLTVIDNRTSKELGTVTAKGETYQFAFPKTPKYAIETAFTESNKDSGKNDIVLLIQELNFFNDDKSPETAKAKISIATFFKRNDKYFFINRTDGVISATQIEGVNVANTITSKISNLFKQLILNSYSSIAVGIPINEDSIANYETIIKNTYPLYKTESLSSGVYLSFKSFVQQKPTPATYHRDKDGDIKGVNDGTYNIKIGDIYCIVEDNKIFKAIPIGYKEVFKDEKGWYIDAIPADLFSQNLNGAMLGGMTGGMVGALIGAAADSGKKNANFTSKVKTHIYLDPLTGEYVFKD